MSSSAVREFALYEHLRTEYIKKLKSGELDVTPEVENNIRDAISNIDYEHLRCVYLLILHFYNLTHKNSPLLPSIFEKIRKNTILPYGMSVSPGGKGASFDLDCMPVELLALLSIFLLP